MCLCLWAGRHIVWKWWPLEGGSGVRHWRSLSLWADLLWLSCCFFSTALLLEIFDTIEKHLKFSPLLLQSHILFCFGFVEKREGLSTVALNFWSSCLGIPTAGLKDCWCPIPWLTLLFACFHFKFKPSFSYSSFLFVLCRLLSLTSFSSTKSS